MNTTPLTPIETKERILDLLDKKDMSKSDLVYWAEDNTNLYKYLRGESKTISADRIAKIAAALNVSCDYLLTDTSDPTGGRVSSTTAANYLGLSPEAVKRVRALNEVQRFGLDSALHDKTGITDLLQIIGETASSVGSDRDYLMFRACRVLCKLLNRL